MIAKIGTGGGQGMSSNTERAIESLSMEGRMTICSMSIEAGARAGHGVPDEHLRVLARGRPHAPTGARTPHSSTGNGFCTDVGAVSTHRVYLDAASLGRLSTGLQPRPRGTGGRGARLQLMTDDAERQAAENVAYMDLRPGTAMRDIAVDASYSSGRVPTVALKICGWSPKCCVAARWPTACGC